MTDNSPLKGLGGWLIIVAIRLIFSCISSLILILYSSIIFIEWSQITNPDSNLYIENLKWVYLFEIGINLIIIFFSSYLLYLFFTKNYKFPSLMICFEFVIVIFKVLDLFINDQFTIFKLEIRDIFITTNSIIWSTIWVLYMLNSVRVKNTFVNRYR